LLTILQLIAYHLQLSILLNRQQFCLTESVTSPKIAYQNCLTVLLTRICRRLSALVCRRLVGCRLSAGAEPNRDSRRRRRQTLATRRSGEIASGERKKEKEVKEHTRLAKSRVSRRSPAAQASEVASRYASGEWRAHFTWAGRGSEGGQI
jgi:hypothetical protein